MTMKILLNLSVLYAVVVTPRIRATIIPGVESSASYSVSQIELAMPASVEKLNPTNTEFAYYPHVARVYESKLKSNCIGCNENNRRHFSNGLDGFKLQSKKEPSTVIWRSLIKTLDQTPIQAAKDNVPCEMREKSKNHFDNQLLHRRSQHEHRKDKREARVDVYYDVLPPNHKWGDQKKTHGKSSSLRGLKQAATQHSRQKTPSPYMEPPKISQEALEHWHKKGKRKPAPRSNDRPVNEDRLRNHRLAGNQKKTCKKDCDNEELLNNHRPSYDREHDPSNRTEEAKREAEASTVEDKTVSPKKKIKNPLILSEDGDRIEFQIHGHQGPQTYMFGYDTGHGKNRHFRLEERLRDTSVKGHYGYYDANGKLKLVEYRVRPEGGYEEKHHESNDYYPDDDADNR